MSSATRLLHRLAHPVWWEDVFPGALLGLPKVLAQATRAWTILLGHPAV